MVNIEEARDALAVLEGAREKAVRLRTTLSNCGTSDPSLNEIISGIDDRIAQILPKVKAIILREILESANEGVRLANGAGTARMPQICFRSGSPS